MRIFLTVALVATLFAFGPKQADAAAVVAKVDISSQTMTVYHHGEAVHTWPVSTARAGKYTPRGSYTAKWLSRHHKSSRYNNAPMPYSIFFRGHYAVHGTNQISRLGQPASAGCIRLHPENAAVLFEMARQYGLKNTKIVIND